MALNRQKLRRLVTSSSGLKAADHPGRARMAAVVCCALIALLSGILENGAGVSAASSSNDASPSAPVQTPSHDVPINARAQSPVHESNLIAQTWSPVHESNLIAQTWSPASATVTATPLALPDLPSYTKEIESIRQLPFKHAVANGRQSLAEFRKFVQKDLDYDLPPPRAACVSHALGLLGLLPEDFDLRNAFSKLLVTQVAAYYNPYKKIFFIVHPDLPESFLKPTVVHELTHALQDQQFGLEARIKALHNTNNDDIENAFRFLAEGEATYVMMLATVRGHGVNLEAGSFAVDQAIEAMSSLDRDGIIAQVESTKKSLGPDMAAEVDAVLSYPDYLFRILFDPYFAGQKAVHHVFRAGGWDAVNGLWANPPLSTELFLHPEKLTKGGPREAPIPVSVPDVAAALGPGYSPACENTLGELETEILLETILPTAAPASRKDASTTVTTPGEIPLATPDPIMSSPGSARVQRAKSAAAGWGGDRYRAFEKAGGGAVVVWKTVWDTEQDAIEFESALREASQARLASMKARPPLSSRLPSTDTSARAPSEAGTAPPKEGPGKKSPGGSPAVRSGAGADGSGGQADAVDPRGSTAVAEDPRTASPQTPAARAAGETRTQREIDGPAPSQAVLPAGWIGPEPDLATGEAAARTPAGGYLLIRQGLEVLFVAGADAAQARAVQRALFRSASPAASPSASPAMR